MSSPSPLAAACLVLVALAGCGGSGGDDVDRRNVVTAETPTASAHGPGTIAVIDKPDNRHTGLYIPADLTVAAGEAVEVFNDSSLPHTITAGTPGATDGAFDSGLFDAGEQFTVVVDVPGTYPYFCTIHPDMTGTLTVTE